MHELNAAYREEAITFVLNALEQFKKMIIAPPEVPTLQSSPSKPTYGRLLSKVKATPQLKQSLIRSASKVSDQAMRIFELLALNPHPTSNQLALFMKCDFYRAHAILKNLIHYGLIQAEEPAKDRGIWKITKTAQWEGPRLRAIIFSAFKRPFSRKPLKISVACDVFEDDLE